MVILTKQEYGPRDKRVVYRRGSFLSKVDPGQKERR